jgi:hypothetical protein
MARDSVSPGGGERLVTITGRQLDVEMAVHLIFHVRKVLFSHSLFDYSCIHLAFGNNNVMFSEQVDVNCRVFISMK